MKYDAVMGPWAVFQNQQHHVELQNIANIYQNKITLRSAGLLSRTNVSGDHVPSVVPGVRVSGQCWAACSDVVKLKNHISRGQHASTACDTRFNNDDLVSVNIFIYIFAVNLWNLNLTTSTPGGSYLN